jgi:hypothetical protein
MASLTAYKDMVGSKRAKKAMKKAAAYDMPTMWAVAGMVGAFAGGALIGMLGGKKIGMRQNGDGYWSEHHHHGFGEDPCCMAHGISEGTYVTGTLDLSDEIE